MLKKLTEYFRGRAVLRIEPRYENSFLRMLLSEKIPAKVYELTENGEKIGIEAVISPKFIRIIASALDKYSIKVYIINIKGFCTLTSSLQRRIGVAVGAAIFLALTWLSSLILWRVDVVGAATVSEDSLREALASAGVSAGAAISDVDAFEVSNQLLLSCPGLSWASLSITGTTATLTVRETVTHENAEKNETPLLIAAEDGVIVSVLVYEGTAAVKAGSVVKAGDALINGLISGSGLQYVDKPVLRIGRADGSVKALVERELSVTVPYREKELVRKDGGDSFRGVYIKLFGIGFYLGDQKPSSELYSEWETTHSPTVFGAALPLTLSETVWNELTELETQYTAEEAEALAREKAENALKAEAGEDRVTFTEYVTHADEENETVTVTVRYRCITEITLSANIGNAN